MRVFRRLPLSRTLILSIPAFWSAFGGPASSHRRGRSLDDSKAATTPMGRRRPPSAPGGMLSSRLPGEPGMTLCGAGRVAGERRRHNVKPRTPMWRAVRVPGGGIGRGSGCRHFDLEEWADCGARVSRAGGTSRVGRPQLHPAGETPAPQWGEALYRMTSRSPFRVEEAPGDGSDVVEETDCRIGLGCIDRAGADEETEVGVDLLRGAVGDSPVVHPIAA